MNKLPICTGFLLVLIIVLSSTQCLAAPEIGVVLGGGAARGFSHIGLLEALEDNGVPIDMLVGTSMGSIVASLYAAGYSIENIKQIVDVLDVASLCDLSLPPKGSFIDTERLQHYLNVLLQNRTFSELGIPFYSVITNILTGEELPLAKGPVSVGVQASMSIPVLFPPVLIEDQYYVDGGMKNAVPANVAADQGADVIIAVDVKKELETIDYDNILTNFQLSMWFMIDGYAQQSMELADVVIVPEVKYDSYMDYEKSAFFIEKGYEAGLAHMEAIKEAILAKDPDFQFVPYRQEGYSPEYVQEILKQAETVIADLPRPFGVLPDISADPGEGFCRLGLKLGHGALSRFNVGYRYGFSPLGGHEVFVGWSKDGIGSLEGFVRKPAQSAGPIWGLHLAAPLSRDARLEALYLSGGPLKWQLSAVSPALIEKPHFNGGLELRLSQERDDSGSDPFYFTFFPRFQLYPAKEPMSIWEIALLRPYFYGGLQIRNPLTKSNPRLMYETGVGGQIQLFGLYPLDLSLGVSAGAGQPLTWKLQLRGGSF